MPKEKVLYSAYLSQSVADVVEFLINREELSKVVFVRKAIRVFVNGDHKIEPRLLIREKSNPLYVKRDRLFTTYVDVEQKEQLEQIAKELHCKVSQVFFQAMIDFCTMLIDQDSTGILIND